MGLPMGESGMGVGLGGGSGGGLPMGTGGIGGGGIPNPTGQLYNLPLIGSLFPNPNEERLQRQMALAARQYSAYRPEVIQARENALRNRLAPFQGASNLLTAMSGGTQPFDATAVSSPIMGTGMKTGNQVQMAPTDQAMNMLEQSLASVPSTPEELRAREEMISQAHPRPADWNKNWLWPGDIRGTHVSQMSPEAKSELSSAPGFSFSSGHNPYQRGETQAFSRPNVSVYNPVAYADFYDRFPTARPQQRYPAMSQTAFEQALNQPSVQLPQGSLSSYAEGQRKAGVAAGRAGQAAGRRAGRRS